ncbi:hypothetical protein V5O48_009866 [Marasmius crinis-equi]|uniref:Chromo domain-containing protein n=1 Tax=Marasmius crinis-equi TaxID=585013 RepID=A0ABR3F9Z4_9AGAR
MNEQPEFYEVGYIRGARRERGKEILFRVKWLNYSRKDNTFVNYVAFEFYSLTSYRSWEPISSLQSAEYSVQTFLENSTRKRKRNGTEVYTANSKWLKQQINNAVQREAAYAADEARLSERALMTEQPWQQESYWQEVERQQEQHDKGEGRSLTADSLWNPPSVFGLNPDDRTETFKMASTCLEEAGIEGKECYRRIKRELADAGDLEWVRKPQCPVCLEEDFDIQSACLATCSDVKTLYCRGCVLKILESDKRRDKVGRVICEYMPQRKATNADNPPIAPMTRQWTYFICTKWVFVNDENARKSAMAESKRRYKKAQKKARKKAKKGQVDGSGEENGECGKANA